MTSDALAALLQEVPAGTPVMIYLESEIYTDFLTIDPGFYAENAAGLGKHRRYRRDGLPVAMFLTPYTHPLTAGQAIAVLQSAWPAAPVMIALDENAYTDHFVVERDGYVENIHGAGRHIRSRLDGLPTGVFLTPFTELAP